MGDSFQFKPFPFLSGGHAQTIVGSVFAFTFPPESTTKFVNLPDGDKLALEYTTPPKWRPDDPTIIMLHGLCGCHKSSYLVRLTKKFYKFGIRTIRINMRGCGSGKGYARNIYHSGCSDDIRIALEEIREEAPESRRILIGFSLGGNIVLKLAGELSLEEDFSLIDHVVSVSPPTNLYSSVCLLDNPVNKMYAKYFMHFLLSEEAFRHKMFPDLHRRTLPDPINFYLLDKHYIVPEAGFQSNEEYYRLCSSARFISHIKIPTHMLFAEDDPIIDYRHLLPLTIPKNVQITVTEHGGHMGFVGSPLDTGGFHWMDTAILKWISKTNNITFNGNV